MRVDVDGISIFAGTGGRPFDAARPAVVLIHGAGLDHTCWPLQSRWLAWHGWSALAIDLPGHGRSGGAALGSIADMVAFIGRFLDAAGVGEAALVGHSMGAVIALETAAAAPERVTKLALLGAATDMPVHPSLLELSRTDPAKAYDLMTGWCHSPAAKLGRNTAPGLWLTGGTRALLGQGHAGALAVDLAACAAWPGGAAAAPKVRCPTLVLSGDGDVMTPAKKGAALATLVPGARMVTLAGCGHMMMSEQPDRVLDALIAHLGTA